MRAVVALTTCLILASAGGAAAQSPPGEEAIKDILISSTSWSVFAEFTQGSTPSDKATKLVWRFYRDGPLFKGRTLNMAKGYNCDFDVVVRDDSLEFSTRARWCADVSDPVMTALVYDSADKAYPFKNLSTPLKWWLAPQP
jgi:hypothetical protein